MTTSVIQEIKSRLRLSDLVGKYTELRPTSGSQHKFTCRCPFPNHRDTSPSFSVYDDTNHFICRGCNTSGDILDFYTLIENVDTSTAINYLAGLAGISRDRAPSLAEKQRQAHLAALSDICAFYRESLFSTKGEDALSYILARGISESTVREFSLGFAPGYCVDEILRILKKHGIPESAALDTGILKKGENGKVYDPFFKRLIFPINSGCPAKLVGFGARTLEDSGPKYVNSSASQYYSKSDHLYGFAQARKSIAETKTAVITEGYTDVLSMHCQGFTNTAGALGTAVTANQIKLLKRALASRVIFLMDGDAPGIEAAKKGIGRALAGGLTPYMAIIPAGQDPAEILNQSDGKDMISQLLENAEPGVEYLYRTLSESPPEFSAWVRAVYADTEDKLIRLVWMAKIAPLFGATTTELLEALEHFKE